MLVRDHMSETVATVERRHSVVEARELLCRHRIRQLPVLRAGRVIGIITHGDLAGCRAGTREIGAVMITDPLVMSPDESLDEAAHFFSRSRKINARYVRREGHGHVRSHFTFTRSRRQCRLLVEAC